MKARIVDIKYEDREVQENRTSLEFWRQHGSPAFDAFDSRINPMMEITREVYDGVKLRSADGREETYFLNSKDVVKVIPMIAYIVEARARAAELKKEHEVAEHLHIAEMKRWNAELRMKQSDDRARYLEECIDELLEKTHIRFLRFIEKQLRMFIAEARSL